LVPAKTASIAANGSASKATETASKAAPAKTASAKTTAPKTAAAPASSTACVNWLRNQQRSSGDNRQGNEPTFRLCEHGVPPSQLTTLAAQAAKASLHVGGRRNGITETEKLMGIFCSKLIAGRAILEGDLLFEPSAC
jgi:hypothetical protein